MAAADMDLSRISKLGCLVIPTFNDTELLEQNFASRAELTEHVDVVILDDNFQHDENLVRFCSENGWTYVRGRNIEHGRFTERGREMKPFIYMMWDLMTKLGLAYRYVLKADTDCLIIDHRWYAEFEELLCDQMRIAGTLEYRPTNQLTSFWLGVARAGYKFELPELVPHLQGGLYGLSSAALRRLRGAGFFHDSLVNMREDSFFSYMCRVLSIPSVSTKTVGSWVREARPPLPKIRNLFAIHPLARSQWQEFETTTGRGDECRRTSSPAELSDSARQESLYFSELVIPPIAHFLWLGTPLPVTAEQNIQRFRQYHPNWDIRVWLNVPDMLPSCLRRMLYCCELLATRSDIIRVWLICNYGGIYLDTDVIAMRNMDELRHYDHFFASEHWGSSVNNGIIGGRPASSMIAEIVRRIEALAGESADTSRLRYGPQLFTRMRSEFGAAFNALPEHYFCILHHWEDPQGFQRKSEEEQRAQLETLSERFSDGTPPYAVHHWGIPKEDMPFNLPQSSFVPRLPIADEMLREIGIGTAHGLHIGIETARATVYLLSHSPQLVITTYLLQDRYDDQNFRQLKGSTAFATGRHSIRVGSSSELQICLTKTSFDWVYLADAQLLDVFTGQLKEIPRVFLSTNVDADELAGVLSRNSFNVTQRLQHGILLAETCTS